MNNKEEKAVENLKMEYEKMVKEDNVLFPLYKFETKIIIELIEKQNKIIKEIKTMYKDFELDPYYNTDVLLCKIKEILSKGEV